MSMLDLLASVSNQPKAGWPWDDEVDCSVYKADLQWPKISIITPSYNQGQYIEETIRSILLQNYPNLEYVIIDGGSTDQTVAVIQKYEKHLNHWVSEPDKGQTDAINKGLCLINGELVNWINSDDILTKLALYQVAKSYLDNQSDIIIGASKTILLEKNGEIQEDKEWSPKAQITLSEFVKEGMNGMGISQPSTYLKLNFLKENNIDIKSYLHYSFDWRLYIDCLKHNPKITTFNHPLSIAKLHPEAKTSLNWVKFIEEGNVSVDELLEEAIMDKGVLVLLKKNKLRNRKWMLFNEFTNKPSLIKAFSFIFKCPQILFYRPFLGAIKKLIIK